MNGMDQGCEALELRHEVLDISPDGARQGLLAIKRFQAVVREVLVAGSDYGTIPGCGTKPTLLKPGAEKVAKLLKCFDGYEFIEKVEDWDKPLFHYLVRCTLSDMASGTKVSSGIGEANSMESKHRYRWIPEDQLPIGFDKTTARKRGGKATLFEPAFAIERKETGGQYGKPLEHWAMFDDAISNRTARSAVKKTKAGKEMSGFEIDVNTTLYQVPNPDIYDIINTLVKMAKKRALVDATLSAGRLSELFTQDLEDLTDEPVQSSPPPPTKPQARASMSQTGYEALKKTPVKDIKDEFTDLPSNTEPEAAEAEVVDPEPESPDGPTMGQLETFAKSKCELDALGVGEELMWTGIHRFSKKTYDRCVTELPEYSPDEMEAVLGYLHRWIKATQAENAKKEKGNAKK